MTDLKKALDCCGKFPVSDCGKCPYKGGTKNCGSLAAIALNCINHREAEIERYKGVIKILENDVANAKSETIKEFAERLKETAYSYSDISGYRSTVVDADSIDNLVKEMTEEER